MKKSIFLMDENKKITELEESEFLTEEVFQNLLAENPMLLSGHLFSEDTPKRWLLVKREAGIADSEYSSNRWSVDHIFLDQDGMPTIVEVKRASDTRLRREVVGQMLDYAANIYQYWNGKTFRDNFISQCEDDEVDPYEKLEEFLDEEIDFDEYWDKVETNLKASKLRLLFVADKIPFELKSIIEFLNEQTHTIEIYGLELNYYKKDNLRTFVPTVVGETTQTIVKKSKGARSWDEESILEELSKWLDKSNFENIKFMLKKLKDESDRLWFGKGNINGSCYPVWNLKNRSVSPISIWSDGSICFEFKTLKKLKPFDDEIKRIELLSQINEITQSNFNDNRIIGQTCIKANLLSSRDVYEKLIEWTLKVKNEVIQNTLKKD